MSIKKTFTDFQHKKILGSKIDDVFDFENTLPPSVCISDNVIDCVNLLKDDERCIDGVIPFYAEHLFFTYVAKQFDFPLIFEFPIKTK